MTRVRYKQPAWKDDPVTVAVVARWMEIERNRGWANKFKSRPESAAFTCRHCGMTQ